jgi:hypothetical protein
VYDEIPFECDAEGAVTSWCRAAGTVVAGCKGGLAFDLVGWDAKKPFKLDWTDLATFPLDFHVPFRSELFSPPCEEALFPLLVIISSGNKASSSSSSLWFP